jgi:cell volume regulation protein A
VLWSGLSLSTIGVFLTALSVGWFVSVVQELSFLEGLLLGAIVASTDAAAVFMVLRARKATIPTTLTNLLEFESGSNDPMGVVLTLAIIQLLANPATSFGELLGFFAVQMTVGHGRTHPVDAQYVEARADGHLSGAVGRLRTADLRVGG